MSKTRTTTRSEQKPTMILIFTLRHKINSLNFLLKYLKVREICMIHIEYKSTSFNFDTYESSYVFFLKVLILIFEKTKILILLGNNQIFIG